MSNSDSEDYFPNAEDNLSIMSDVTERMSDQTEIDIDEINEVLLKNLESDVFNMQNEVKQKDFEMQQLLEEIQKQYFAEKDKEFAQVIVDAAEEYEEKIQVLQEKVTELEEDLNQEREQNAEYFTTIETLKSENERLRNENRKQQADIAALNDKFKKFSYSSNRSTANNSVIMTMPPSPIGAAQTWFSKGVQAEKNRNGLFELAEDASTSDLDATGIFKPTVDEVWINKFELVKEKLASEQNRSRELEFMLVTQKNIIENANENVTKLKQENKTLEAKIETMRSEIETITRTRLVDKSKVDSVITFCDLMENCVFPKNELVEKLSQLPYMISSYLKGEMEVLSFNKAQSTQSKLAASSKKVNATLERLEENQKEDKNIRVGHNVSELDNLRNQITNLTQFVSQSLGGTSPVRDGSLRVPISEGFNSDNSTSKDLTPNKKQSNFKSSMYIARAVQNSTSLLWNFKRASTIGRIDTPENQ